MKKYISLVLTTVFVFAFMFCVCVSVSAEGTDNLTFALNEDGVSYCVAECSSSVEGEVVVPEKYNDLPVTTIGNYAFYDCAYITSISLPETINNIDHHAFYFCSKLVSLNIPASVTKIGEHAFSGTKLTSITIPEGVESIAAYTFYDCTALVSVEIPATIKTIEKNAFYYCTKLESIVLPEGLTEIGAEAFLCCRNIKSIEIPESVTTIGGRAFGDCQSLVSVKLPAGITTISKSLFDYCKSLEEITIPEGVKTIEACAFEDCIKLEKITIPDTVTRIGARAFSDCQKLAEIKLPKELTKIGEHAFWYCDSLKTISLPEKVTSLGGSVFGNCENLELIYVDSKNKEFASENGVLFNKDKTTLLVCPTALPMSTYKVPGSVKTIEVSAFYGNKTLVNVELPDGLTSIAGTAFYWCESLEKINIPDSVTSIGDAAFGYCKKLESVKLPKNLKSVGKSAFIFCTSLTDVTLQKGLKSIGSSAFKDCKKLESISVPGGVTRIYDNAFSGCESLKEINLPDSISRMGKDIFYNTAYYKTKGNWKKKVLYVGNHLVKARTSLSGEYEIRKNTRTIANEAFEYCDKVTGVKMPDSLVYIGDYAFYECRGLESLNVPDKVTYIGDRAFFCCYGLKSVKLGDGLKSIGDLGFYSCARITDITFGKGLQSIGSSAFYNCDKIDDVFFYEGLISISSHAFYDCDGLISLVIPSSVKEIGECAAGYYVTCDEGEQVIYSDFEIYGAKGSVAEQYANNVGLTFVEHESHSFGKWVVVDEPTVYAQGYKYRECSVCMSKEKVDSSQLKCSNPTLKSIRNTPSGVKITWGKVKGGDSYNIYRRTKSGSYNKIGTTKNTYYTDKKAKSGKRYYYIVKAVNEAGTSASSSAKSILHLAAPKLKKIQNATGGLKITWSKVSGADGYYVYRKLYGADSWTKIATIKKGSTVTYKDKKVIKGKVYVYAVKAYDGRRKSALSVDDIKLRYLAVPTLKSVTSTTNGIKFTWGKVTGAEGYYVYRKTGSGDWKRIATVKGNSKVTYLDKTAKKGTTYKYTVKAYKGETNSYYNTTGLTVKDKY